MSEILGYMAVLGVMLTGFLAWLGGRNANKKALALAKTLGENYVTQARGSAKARTDAARTKGLARRNDAESKATKDATDAATVTDLADYLNHRGTGPR